MNFKLNYNQSTKTSKHAGTNKLQYVSQVCLLLASYPGFHPTSLIIVGEKDKEKKFKKIKIQCK